MLFRSAVDTYGLLENAREKKLVTVKTADHGFGAWDNHPELSKQLTDATIEFFRSNL